MENIDLKSTQITYSKFVSVSECSDNQTTVCLWLQSSGLTSEEGREGQEDDQGRTMRAGDAGLLLLLFSVLHGRCASCPPGEIFSIWLDLIQYIQIFPPSVINNLKLFECNLIHFCEVINLKPSSGDRYLRVWNIPIANIGLTEMCMSQHVDLIPLLLLINLNPL